MTTRDPGAGPNPLAEQVYLQLKDDIFNFRLFPGDRFSETDIADHYGVSRTPMRDGLFRLQREGYLEVGFRRGWRVAQLDFARLDQLYDLRIVLELAALERLCADVQGAASHGALEALRAIWCGEVASREVEPVAMFQLDEDFHRRLVAASENHEMLRVHNEVSERIRIVRRLDFLKPRRVDATYEEHAMLINLAARGKTTEATILLRSHITQSKLEVRKITLSMLSEARDQKLDFVS
jgi:DNA-binding GntR family transcriptional regulator